MKHKIISTVASHELACLAVCEIRRQLNVGNDVDVQVVLEQPASAAVPPKVYSSEGEVKDLLNAIKGRNKIGAIKAYRALTGTGLKEAKDAIDSFDSLFPFHP